MNKSELIGLVNKNVFIHFKDGKNVHGILKYADEFSPKYDYRKPNYFYIDNISFKASHIKKLVESED